MNLFRSFSFVVFCFLSTSTNAMFLVHTKDNPILPEQIDNDNSKFPEVCLIQNKREKNASCGTCTLISPKIVLTAKHVLTNEKSEGRLADRPMADPSQLTIKFGTREVGASEIIVPKFVNLDIAMIVLSEAISDIQPRTIRQYKFEKLNMVSVAGYGFGRVIHDWDNPEYTDGDRKVMKLSCMSQSLNAMCKNVFRFRENLTVFKTDTVSAPTGELLIISSKDTRVGDGDSGGPLLDAEGRLIGVAISGNKDFLEVERKLYQQAEAAVCSALDNKTFRMTSPVINKAMPIFEKIMPFAFGCVGIYAAYKYMNWGKLACLGAGIVSSIALDILADKVTEKVLGSESLQTKLFNSYALEPVVSLYQQRDREVLELLKTKTFGNHYIYLNAELAKWIQDAINAHGA